MEWKPFLIRKLFGNHLNLNDIDEISPATFRKHLFLNLIPFGIFTISISAIYIHLETSQKAVPAFYLLCGSALLFFILSQNFYIKFLRHTMGRLKSIDPKVKMGWRWAGHAWMLYAPFLFIPYLLFLSFAPPRSYTNKMSTVLNAFSISFAVYILAFLLSFATPLLPSQPSNRSAVSKATMQSSYYFLGPASFFIQELTQNTTDLIQIKNQEIINIDSMLDKTKQVCREPHTHEMILAVSILKNLRRDEEQLAADTNRKFLALNYLVKSFKNCDNVKPAPYHFNPIWAFLPANALEGSLMLIIDSLVGHMGQVKIAKIIESEVKQLEENVQNKEQLNEFKQKYLQTDFYEYTQSVRNSSLAKIL